MKEELPKPTPDRDPDREKGSIPEDFGLKPGGVEKIRKERKPRRSEAEDEFPAKAPPIPKEETISRPESGSQILDQAEPAESPVSPSLESKTGTPQAPEAQPPTNELLDPRLQAAAQHVIMRKDATPAMLERYLNVNTAEADDLIARLQKLGVVGPWRKNRREVNWTIDDLKQRIGIKPTRTAAPKTPEPAPSKKENKETLASPTDTPAPAAQKTGRYVRLPGAARPEPAEAPPTPETLPPLVAEQPSKPEKTREEAIIASINQAESSFAVILTSLNQNLTNLEKQLRTEATFRAETEIRGVTQTLENSIRDLRTQRELLEAGKITAEQAEVITSSTIIKAQNKLNEVKELLGGLALDETPQTQPKTETPATAAASEKPSQPETTETRKRSWISRHRRQLLTGSVAFVLLNIGGYSTLDNTKKVYDQWSKEKVKTEDAQKPTPPSTLQSDLETRIDSLGQIVKVLEAEKEQEIREKMAENPEDFAPATEPSLDEGKKTPPPPVRDVNGPESSRDFRPPISVPHESPTPPPPAQNQEGAALGSQKEKNASREDLTTKVSALEKEVLSQSGMPEVEFESIKSRSVKYFLSRYGGTMGLLEFGLGRPGEGTTVEERAHRVNFANWLERALGKPGVNRQMADQMSLEEFFRYVASLNQNPK